MKNSNNHFPQFFGFLSTRATRLLASLCMMIVITTLAAYWHNSSVKANPKPQLPEHNFCDLKYTEEDLKGCYGWTGTGLVPSSTQTSAGVGLITFDGSGNVFGSYSGNDNGLIVVKTYTGSYTVAANGSGTIRWHEVSPAVDRHFDFVMVTGGNEIFATSTDSMAVQNLDMKRQ